MFHEVEGASYNKDTEEIKIKFLNKETGNSFIMQLDMDEMSSLYSILHEAIHYGEDPGTLND